MSTEVILALIGLAGLIVTQVANLMVARQTVTKLSGVSKQIDGQQTMLLEATAAKSVAIGEVAGREKARAEARVQVAEAERVADRAAARTEPGPAPDGSIQLTKIEDTTDRIDSNTKP